MRVSVYRNLRRGGYSLRAETGPNRGRVIEVADDVLIARPIFVVRPAGRERVLRERQKNVHAFVRGELISTGAEARAAGLPQAQRFTYDPYRMASFEVFGPDGERAPILISLSWGLVNDQSAMASGLSGKTVACGRGF